MKFDVLLVRWIDTQKIFSVRNSVCFWCSELNVSLPWMVMCFIPIIVLQLNMTSIGGSCYFLFVFYKTRKHTHHLYIPLEWKSTFFSILTVFVKHSISYTNKVQPMKIKRSICNSSSKGCNVYQICTEIQIKYSVWIISELTLFLMHHFYHRLIWVRERW